MAAFSGYAAVECFYYRRAGLSNVLQWLTTWILVQLLGAQTLDIVRALRSKSRNPQVLTQRVHQLRKEAIPFQQGLKLQGGRRFCITERGYIGWVTEAAREGDDVAMFYGARVLYALRRVDGGFKLVASVGLRVSGSH